MAPDQFVRDMPRDLLEIERPALARQLAMKDDLQQQIAEFFQHLVVVTGFNGVHQFIDFLDGVEPQRSVVLFAVPGTTRGRPQPAHDLDQPVDRGIFFHRGESGYGLRARAPRQSAVG